MTVRGRRLITPVFTALATCVAGLAACTSGGDPLNGEQTKTAAQVLADAAQALRTAQGVHYIGQGRVKGVTIRYDIHMHGSDAIGKIRGSDGVEMDLLRVQGTGYFRGGSGPNAQVESRIKGRWIEESPETSLEPLTTLSGLADTLAGNFKVDGKVQRSKRDGRDVLVLTGSDLSGPATIEVALHGPPHPVHATSDGNEPGAEDFTDYDSEVTVSPPANVVTAAQYRDLIAKYGDSPESHIRWPITQ